MALLLSIGGGSLHDGLDTDVSVLLPPETKGRAPMGQQRWLRCLTAPAERVQWPHRRVDTACCCTRSPSQSGASFFLPLRSLSVWFSLGRMVNQRQHVLLSVQTLSLCIQILQSEIIDNIIQIVIMHALAVPNINERNTRVSNMSSLHTSNPSYIV
jgi:hypothetical protein